MMPAVAPQPVSDDPRKVKRTLPWQKRKSALAEARAWDARPEAHIVEPRPPSSGYGRDARVAPAKKTPSLLSKPRDADARSFGRSPTKQGSVFSTAGRAPVRMPTSGLWTPHWPPNELGDEEDLRGSSAERARASPTRARTRRLDRRASPTRALSPTKPKPPTPPLFEEDPLPLASHDPDNPSHEGLVAVATRTARRWNAARGFRREPKRRGPLARPARARRRPHGAAESDAPTEIAAGAALRPWAAARSPATTSRSGRRRARARRGGASWRSRGRRSGVGRSKTLCVNSEESRVLGWGYGQKCSRRRRILRVARAAGSSYCLPGVLGRPAASAAAGPLVEDPLATSSACGSVRGGGGDCSGPAGGGSDGSSVGGQLARC